MRDEPTDGSVDRPIRRRVPVRKRWRAIDFTGRPRLLVRYPLSRQADTSQGSQRDDSNRTENAENDYGYEPRPEALTDLEDRRSGSSHGRLSELSSSNKECERKRACDRVSKCPRSDARIQWGVC